MDLNLKFFKILFIICLSISANAHSGRTDASGCHTNRQTGDYHCHNSKRHVSSAVKSQSENYQVIFNTKSKKIHRPHCRSAKACTKNCIPIMKAEAITQGGVPCANCGG